MGFYRHFSINWQVQKKSKYLYSFGKMSNVTVLHTLHYYALFPVLSHQYGYNEVQVRSHAQAAPIS